MTKTVTHPHVLSQDGAPGTSGEHYFDPATGSIYHRIDDHGSQGRRYDGFLHRPNGGVQARILSELIAAGHIPPGDWYFGSQGVICDWKSERSLVELMSPGTVAPRWCAVWGFASTGSECGVLSEHITREDAVAAASAWLAREKNPAVGAWVRPI